MNQDICTCSPNSTCKSKTCLCSLAGRQCSVECKCKKDKCSRYSPPIFSTPDSKKPVKTNYCSRCGEHKPSKEFSANKSKGKDGKQAWCKQCFKGYQHNINYEEKFPEKEERLRHQASKCLICERRITCDPAEKDVCRS